MQCIPVARISAQMTDINMFGCEGYRFWLCSLQSCCQCCIRNWKEVYSSHAITVTNKPSNAPSYSGDGWKWSGEAFGGYRSIRNGQQLLLITEVHQTTFHVSRYVHLHDSVMTTKVHLFHNSLHPEKEEKLHLLDCQR